VVSRPKLSVCIVSFNRAARLDETLASLAAQTRPPDELIVSDDCSADDSAQVAVRWQRSGAFRSVRLNRNARNLGMPANLNVAVGMASGEYVANLHDGDRYAPDMLERWERALDEHPTAGFVFCGVSGWPHRTAHGPGVILHDVEPLTRGLEFFERHFLHRFSSIVWGTVMARARAYDELLPFDPAYQYIADVDMWMRMCERWDVAYVRAPLIHLDFSPSPWRSFRWDRLDLMRAIQVEHLRRKYGDDPDRLRRELTVHRHRFTRLVLERLAARIARGDVRAVLQGLRYARRPGWPLGPQAQIGVTTDSDPLPDV
jgi:glycosyltransferase involved in cell wall biosynthesis